MRQPSDRRPDPNASSHHSSGSGVAHNSNELIQSQSVDADSNALDAEPDQRDRYTFNFTTFFVRFRFYIHSFCAPANSSKSKSAPVSVNRSESYKETLAHRRNRKNRRKTSDPSLSKTKWVFSLHLTILIIKPCAHVAAAKHLCEKICNVSLMRESEWKLKRRTVSFFNPPKDVVNWIFH